MKRFVFVLAGCLAVAAGAVEKLTPPGGRPVRVAVVVTERATLIDFAGPWEVFQDVQLPHRQGFELYTVSDDTQPRTISAGMKVVPNFSYADAPTPDIVVIGAQAGSPATLAWLRQQAPRVQLMMSVCVGASKLAAIGLLDGKEAATHHDFVDSLNQKFPKVTFLRAQRFVESDPRVITAGGLTSGIDAALHVVERYYGRAVAEQTAAYMEYESTSWKRDWALRARGAGLSRATRRLACRQFHAAMRAISAPPPPALKPLLDYLNSLQDGRADLDRLHQLLTESRVTMDDVKPFLHFEDDCYCRNLLAESPWFNVLVLCWKSGQRSPIHDHAQSVCAFKVLTGVCSETSYSFSPCGQVVPVRTKDFLAGEIVASHDSETHQVSNLQPEGTPLVTLHVYSPPLKTMKVFSIMGKTGGKWLAPEHKAVGA